MLKTCGKGLDLGCSYFGGSYFRGACFCALQGPTTGPMRRSKATIRVCVDGLVNGCGRVFVFCGCATPVEPCFQRTVVARLHGRLRRRPHRHLPDGVAEPPARAASLPWGGGAGLPVPAGRPAPSCRGVTTALSCSTTSLPTSPHSAGTVQAAREGGPLCHTQTNTPRPEHPPGILPNTYFLLNPRVGKKG